MRGLDPDVTFRRNGACAVAVLAALAAGCVHAPPGVGTANAELTDRTLVAARPGGWARIAVIPFGGDPAHRRPAEELVALWVQRTAGLPVATPYAIRAAAPRAPTAGTDVALDADAWAQAYVDGGEPPREAVRAAGRWLGADALVVGRVAPGGRSADLVLVHAASGDAVVAVRRAGHASAAALGVHELAVDATGRALEALIAGLRAAPGQLPRIRLPGDFEPMVSGEQLP